MPLLKVFLIWLIILSFAILNGIFREKYLLLYFELENAFFLSGIILSIFILLITYYSINWFGKIKNNQCFFIGLIWLTLTLLFEFSFGMILLKKSLSQMLDAYKLQDGNIWTIILIIIFFAPCLVSKIKKL